MTNPLRTSNRILISAHSPSAEARFLRSLSRATLWHRSPSALDRVQLYSNRARLFSLSQIFLSFAERLLQMHNASSVKFVLFMFLLLCLLFVGSPLGKSSRVGPKKKLGSGFGGGALHHKPCRAYKTDSTKCSRSQSILGHHPGRVVRPLSLFLVF